MTVQAGDMAELCQMRSLKRSAEPEWLPFMVTHVHADGVVSGVAFSGEPGAIGWHRGAMEFTQASRGGGVGCWRERPALEMQELSGGAAPLTEAEVDAMIEAKIAAAKPKPRPRAKPKAPTAKA